MSTEKMDDQQRAREQFEAWCKGRYSLATRQDSLGNGVYVDRWVQGAWVGFRAALRAAPEGFVLVPVEPTREMLKEIHLIDAFTYEALCKRYAAMLAARPQGVKDA